MSQAVLEILDRIRHLPSDERAVLDEELARLSEAEWQREAVEARRLAKEKGVDQAAIDRAVEAQRYAR